MLSGACGNRLTVVLVNDVLKENVTTQDLDKALDNLPADPKDYKDPTVTWHDDHH